MAIRTAQELEDERLRAMGPDLGRLYDRLWRHVVELHGELQEFRKLYGSPSAVAVLNDTAGGLFKTVRKVLWEHVLLYVARLTDDPTTGGATGKPNLTLRRLPSVISDPALKRQVADLIAGASKRWEPVRTLRNKWLAHLDLHIGADDPRAEPLPAMDMDAVEGALASMADILSRVEEWHWGPADRRYYPHRPLGCADDLIFWLRRGLEAEAQRRDRLLNGRALPEDLNG